MALYTAQCVLLSMAYARCCASAELSFELGPLRPAPLDVGPLSKNQLIKET